ncbi:hypothetical protein C8J57DRAFT_1246582 [Mycena rebaudengoi]|nr:hypothetical protein C8J57DRAFT_1246582 [Mycena rebaudengoi]
MSLSHLSGIVEELIKLSATDDLFIFRSKADILKLRDTPKATNAPASPETVGTNPKTPLPHSPGRRSTTPVNDTQHNSPPPAPESRPVTPKALTPTPHSSPKVPQATNPLPPPLPPATAAAVDGAVDNSDSTKKRTRKRKAESQLVPETAQDSSSSSGRAPQVRKTAAEASADRRQKALDDAGRPKAKPGWAYVARSPKK